MLTNKFLQAFELSKLFRNIYFWLAIGGLMLLFYVGFITFFLPKTTSEITDSKPAEPNNKVKPEIDEDLKNSEDDEPSAGIDEDKSGSDNPAKLKGVKFQFVRDGGWVDTDDRRMTIVVKALNLKADIIDAAIRSNSVGITIDDVEAKIINIEPYKKSQLLARAFAPLPVEKFDKFVAGDTQKVKVTVVLHHAGKTADDKFVRTFSKTDKTDVEGIRVKWNK
jgi:hypothetical protein